MNDILLFCSSNQYLNERLTFLVNKLKEQNLNLTPEEIQKQSPYNYLGYIITQQQIHHHRLNFKLPKQCIYLRLLMKIWGLVNWAHPFLSITTKDWSLLFDLLPEGSQLNSLRNPGPEVE